MAMVPRAVHRTVVETELEFERRGICVLAAAAQSVVVPTRLHQLCSSAPQVSALEQDIIEVDPETKEMLKSLVSVCQLAATSGSLEPRLSCAHICGFIPDSCIANLTTAVHTIIALQ